MKVIWFRVENWDWYDDDDDDDDGDDGDDEVFG